MSVFDLFRGFFRVPGSHRGRKDPFFDAMTHDDDDDDDDDDGFHYDGFRADPQDPFDGAWRFGFSFGPDGMRLHEPPMFGHVLREMEELFSQMGRWNREPDFEFFASPSIMPPPPSQDRAEIGGGRSGRNLLRDFMLKSPDSDSGPCREPRNDSHPSYKSPEFPSSPFHSRTPLSKFSDIWTRGSDKAPEEGRREDGDLDSIVSSKGLDQILTPPAGQAPHEPRTRSFFQSVTVTKVVKPDGTVEERRTVRDSQGNEKTTVIRSEGTGNLEGPRPQIAPLLPGAFSDMRDDESLFAKFFRGFK